MMSAFVALRTKVPVEPTTKPVAVPVPPFAIVKAPLPTFSKPFNVNVVLLELLPHVAVPAAPVYRTVFAVRPTPKGPPTAATS